MRDSKHEDSRIPRGDLPFEDNDLLPDGNPFEQKHADDAQNTIVKRFIRILGMSGVVIVIAAIIGITYSLINHSALLVRYMYNAGFIVSAVIIGCGLVLFGVPVRMWDARNKHLIDHTNYAAVVMTKRENKRRRAFDILYIGILSFVIVGIVEMIVWRLST